MSDVPFQGSQSERIVELESLLAQERAKVAELNEWNKILANDADIRVDILAARDAEVTELKAKYQMGLATEKMMREQAERYIKKLEGRVGAMWEAVERVCQDMRDWLAAEYQLPQSQVGGTEAIAPWEAELSEALSSSGGHKKEKP